MARSTNHTTKENKYISVSITPEELAERKRIDKPIWQLVLQIMKDVPTEELDRLPTDGSQEHDHYIYGTPKKNL